MLYGYIKSNMKSIVSFFDCLCRALHIEVTLKSKDKTEKTNSVKDK